MAKKMMKEMETGKAEKSEHKGGMKKAEKTEKKSGKKC